MAKFTQGEWKITKIGNMLFIDSPSFTLAEIRVKSSLVEHKEEAEANARLIASAPKMYEALKLLVERFEEMNGKYPYPMTLDLPRVWAEEVLAEVEKET